MDKYSDRIKRRQRNSILMRRSYKHLILVTLLAAHSFLPANAAKLANRAATVSKTQVITNPKSTSKIVLSGYRRSTVKGCDEAIWQIVSIQTSDGKMHEVANAKRDEPGDGYQQGAWSPDGQYFTLLHVVNFGGPTEKQDVMYIVGLQSKGFVNFSTKSGEAPTFDNSEYAWIQSKPHSIALRVSGADAEALPDQ